MSAAVAAHIVAVHPDGAFIVDGAETSEHTILLGLLLGVTGIFNVPLVPQDFVDALLVDTRGRSLENVGYLDSLDDVSRNAIQMPLFVESLVVIIEDEVPGSVQRCPRLLSLKVGAWVFAWC